ncbi:MAG: hypothetical protein ABIZ49_08030 [Opitutaceae bacterium]
MFSGLFKSEDGQKLILTAGAALLVAVTAQVTLSPDWATTLLLAGGYWFELAATLGFGWALARNYSAIRQSLAWTRNDTRCLVAVALMAVVLLVHEAGGFKIMMDEIHLLGTSMTMHFKRAVYVPQRGHDLQGVFQLMAGLVDKRPLFFPFLVSVLHDLTGYRTANPFLLNGALTFVFLGLSYLGGRALGGWRGGLLAALWWTGLPLLGQNARGGGFELLNLVMILATALLAGWHYRRRDEWSLNALVFSGVLLAQTRYESPLFLVPVVVVILLVWIEDRAVRISWLTVASPVLLLPVPLLLRIFQARPESWELASKPGSTAVFSVSNIPDNVGHALAFWFDFGVDQPNSPALAATGLLALFFCLVRLPRWWSTWRAEPPAVKVGLFFGAALVAHLLMMLSYFWGKFDDPVIRRLSLPTHLLLVFATLLAARDFRRIDRALTTMLVVAGLALAITGVPGLARQAATRLYYPALDVAWRREFMSVHPERDYLVLDNDSTLWITHLVSATPVTLARTRPETIAFNLRNRMFSAIYVFQRLDIDENTGALKIRPDDNLGSAYELEVVAERSFRVDLLSRLSRVTGIRPPNGERVEAVPIATVDSSATERTARESALLEKWLKNLP